MATITFQEGVDSYTGCLDTYLFDGAADTNYGTDGSLLTKDSPDAGYTRMFLISFDISNIPDDATITSVTLDLFVATAGTTTDYLYTCLRNWGETTATWNKYDGTTSWTTGGCRSDGNDMTGTFGTSTGILSSLSHGGEAYGTQKTYTSSSAFVSAVQNALATDRLNMVVHQSLNANVYATWLSSEEGDTSVRPRLTVVYTPAGGGIMTTRTKWWGDI